jgi:Flp pilus assembly protein TadG
MSGDQRLNGKVDSVAPPSPCKVPYRAVEVRVRGESMRSLRGAGGLWSRDGGRRGAVAVLVALMLVVIIGFVSLGTEVVLLLLTSRHMQSAADTAALAAETARLSGSPANYAQEAFALSAAAGFANGQSGTTVTVNSPPKSGNYANVANAVEVLIAQPQTLALAQVLYSGTAPPFTVRARAVAHPSSNGSCTLTLDSTGNGSLSMNGTTVANLVGCDASVNSTSATAVTLVGGATLNANRLYDAGGYTLKGGAQINGAITTQAAPTADPYAGYVMPAAGACLQTRFNPPASVTISPGTYCIGINVHNGVVLTLNPGVYIIDRGSFNVTGGGSLSGAGVTIVLTSSTGASYATVGISGGATVTLSAPSSGAMAGLVFFQDRNAPANGTNTFNGGAGQSITGALYFPQQSVTFGGGTASNTTCVQVIAWDLTLDGNATLEADCAGTGVLAIGGGQSAMVE